MNRILFVLTGLGFLLVCFNNCSGSSFDAHTLQTNESSQLDGNNGSTNWTPGPNYTFTEGTNSSVDLSTTLPVDVVKGGVFEVSASGTQLPLGMNLSANGILSLNNAGVGETAGVVFTYTEPQ